ncbi:MAG: hypothetical protein ACLFV4_01275 [Candidatus Hydrogenedentota bacterium]
MTRGLKDSVQVNTKIGVDNLEAASVFRRPLRVLALIRGYCFPQAPDKAVCRLFTLSGHPLRKGGFTGILGVA